jgi:hypothetical protein
MSRLDDLLPDQRATLSLLLRQRKTYAEVAALLSIQEGAVRNRAHAALAVLAPRQARALAAQQREGIGDYLLGQQADVAERLRTRTFLMGSAPGRDWARAITGELAPLAVADLPEIPDAPAAADAYASAPEPSSPAPRPPPAPAQAPSPAVQAPAPAPEPPAPTGGETAPSPPSSRRAGAVLLAVIAAAVVVAVILFAGGGGHSGTTATGSAATGSAAAGSSSAGSASSGSSAEAGKAREDRRITLTPPNPSSKAVGVAEVLSEGNKYAFYLAAEHLQPSRGFFYAVWLYNSPSSNQALSRSPPVGSDGRLQGGALLPANAAQYHTMLLTRETSSRPTHPGPVVLSGAFALH